MSEYIWNIHGRLQFYAILTRQNEKPTGLWWKSSFFLLLVQTLSFSWMYELSLELSTVFVSLFLSSFSITVVIVAIVVRYWCEFFHFYMINNTFSFHMVAISSIIPLRISDCALHKPNSNCCAATITIFLDFMLHLLFYMLWCILCLCLVVQREFLELHTQSGYANNNLENLLYWFVTMRYTEHVLDCEQKKLYAQTRMQTNKKRPTIRKFNKNTKDRMVRFGNVLVFNEERERGCIVLRFTFSEMLKCILSFNTSLS